MVGSLVVFHQGALGDFVLSLSVIKSVRDYLNASEVIAVAGAPSAQLAAGRSAVDHCLSPDSVHLHDLFSSTRNPHPSLKAVVAEADWVLSFLGDGEDATTRSLRRTTRRPVVAIDPRPTDETVHAGRHITQQWTDAIRTAGWHINDPSGPQIRWISPEELQLDRPSSVMIHPGSGSRDKCWSVKRFLALGGALNDVRVIWLIGPAEMDRDAAAMQNILDSARTRGHECVVNADLPVVVDRMAAASVYVGNDAGTTHLAAAVGVPVVAIFRMTDPRIWRPLNRNITVLESDLDVEAVCHAVRELGLPG